MNINDLRKTVRVLMALHDLSQMTVAETIGTDRKSFNMALRKRENPKSVEYLQMALEHLKSLPCNAPCELIHIAKECKKKNNPE
jgi:DNA-binding XRE family transcriptional regulator